jgi:hypothetical protein
MPKFISRRWTVDDIAKLKEMAGKYPATQIATELGRGPSATRVKAHQLKVSLRLCQPYSNLERSPQLENSAAS